MRKEIANPERLVQRHHPSPLSFTADRARDRYLTARWVHADAVQ